MRRKVTEVERDRSEARPPLWDRVREAVGGSAWAPLGGKAAAYVAGFFALALVGSGKALQLLPHPGGPAGTEMALLYGAAVAGATAPSEPRPVDGNDGNDAGAAEGAADAGAAEGAADAGAVEGAADAGAPGGGVTADGKVVLNLATAEDLRRLPGVGPAKAAAILGMRAKLKRFRKVEDLLRVKGIGRRSLQRLRPLVVLDPP